MVNGALEGRSEKSKCGGVSNFAETRAPHRVSVKEGALRGCLFCVIIRSRREGKEEIIEIKTQGFLMSVGEKN